MYHRLRNRFGRARWNSYVTWVMSNLVSIRLETVLVSLQDRCTDCAKHTMAQKSFWMHRWYSYVMRLKRKLVSVYLEIVLVLMQDWCMVCAERTIGSNIILDAPDETSR